MTGSADERRPPAFGAPVVATSGVTDLRHHGLDRHRAFSDVVQGFGELRAGSRMKVPVDPTA